MVHDESLLSIDDVVRGSLFVVVELGKDYDVEIERLFGAILEGEIMVEERAVNGEGIG